MPTALSNDIRERIADTYLRDILSYDEVAKRYKVGRATVVRLVARKKRTGSVAPTKQKRGSEPKLGETEHEFIRALVEAKPDITIGELTREFNSMAGFDVSKATVGRVLGKLKLTRKKRL